MPRGRAWIALAMESFDKCPRGSLGTRVPRDTIDRQSQRSLTPHDFIDLGTGGGGRGAVRRTFLRRVRSIRSFGGCRRPREDGLLFLGTNDGRAVFNEHQVNGLGHVLDLLDEYIKIHLKHTEIIHPREQMPDLATFNTSTRAFTRHALDDRQIPRM